MIPILTLFDCQPTRVQTCVQCMPCEVNLNQSLAHWNNNSNILLWNSGSMAIKLLGGLLHIVQPCQLMEVQLLSPAIWPSSTEHEDKETARLMHLLRSGNPWLIHPIYLPIITIPSLHSPTISMLPFDHNTNLRMAKHMAIWNKHAKHKQTKMFPYTWQLMSFAPSLCACSLRDISCPQTILLSANLLKPLVYYCPDEIP